MINNSQSVVSFQNFIGVANKAGTQTIWGEMRELIKVSNLVNDQILGNVLNRKKTTTADTFPYEYQYIPKVSIADNRGATGLLGTKDLIKMEKTTLVFNSQWLTTGYSISVLAPRTMTDWAQTLSNFEKNMYISKNDIDNLITMEKVIDYAYATGRYKLLPNLDSELAATPEEKNLIVDAMTKMLETIKAISIKKTDVGYGQSADRSQLVVSEYVEVQFMKAANFINASNDSFAIFQSGKLGRFGGVGYSTSLYLDKFDKAGTTDNNVGDYDFTNVLGFVFDIDNTDTWTKPWTQLGDAAGFIQNYEDLTLKARQVQWKTMCVIKPSREHLNYLFVRVAPTLDQVNASRARLKAEQPQFYGNFAPIDAATLTLYNNNSVKPRVVYGSDTPNDNGIPSLLAEISVKAKVSTK